MQVIGLARALAPSLMNLARILSIPRIFS